MVEIRRIVADDDFSVSGINSLLAQQSPDVSHRTIEAGDLRDSLRNPLFHLLVAISPPNRYVGMATIFFQRNIARWIAEIHDVVVDEEFRGQRIGEKLTVALMETALQFSRDRDVKIKLFLTSRPRRVAANALYRKLGFVLVAEASGEWGTNLYKIIVEPSGLRGLS